MRIAIDARMYGTAQRGIGRYLMKLIENLEVVDKQNRYTLFLRKQNFNEYTSQNPNFKKAIWDTQWYGIKEQLGFRSIVNKDIDLYHFPHFNVPYFFPKPFVMTLHDLELFSSNRTRSSSTKGRLTYAIKMLGFKIVLNHAVKKARAIIVPSNYVKKQVLKRWPKLKEKVHVVYEAPTLMYNSQSSVHSLLEGKYVLYVGAAYPHKNLDRLFKAWQMIHKKLGDEYKLVLVGREDFFWKKIKSQVTNPQAILYGQASDQELASLYKNAALLIQPSLEEGFSLSPLEALTFGCPAAVSDIPVHHEVLGEAGIFFNPHNTHSIANTLIKVLTNKNLRAKILTHKTTLRARYSWKKHAKETLALYEATQKV